MESNKTIQAALTDARYHREETSNDAVKAIEAFSWDSARHLINAAEGFHFIVTTLEKEDASYE